MIINGNALDVMRELKPRTFGGLITDPPYSSGGMFRGDRAADTKTKYTDDVAKGAPVLVFYNWRQVPTITDALQWAGFIWRGIHKSPWNFCVN